MNRLGMLVDVSHVSKPAMLQAAALSARPWSPRIPASTRCARCRATWTTSSWTRCGDTAALVQITAVASFLQPQGKSDSVTVGDYMDHLDYAVRRCGIEHVGISSDFDGGGTLSGWRDAAESANLTAELVRRGYDASEIAALWGGNFLRLMARAEAVAA